MTTLRIVRRSVLLALVLAASPARAQQPDLLVFAAASLKNALDEANALYRQQSGQRAVAAYAASSALARQIEAGAPADVFVSADLDWMDHLEQRRLVREGSRANLLGNRLVLVAPARSATQLRIAPGFALAAALGPDGRLAMADTNAVPAGKYGKAALEKLGVWASVAGRVAPAESVRAALLLVSRGETPLGIVYQTDAAVDPNVRIVDGFPADSHPPIVYPIAILARSTHPGAARYVDVLRSPAARPAFEKQGFTILP